MSTTAAETEAMPEANGASASGSGAPQPEPRRQVPDTRVGRWWMLSMLLSAILLVVLLILWVERDGRPQPTGDQLVDRDAVETALDRLQARDSGAPEVRLPTGVFIQSLVFRTTNDVHLTGYIWHRFPGDVRNAVGTGSRTEKVPVVVDGVADPISISPGFILPEQVDSSFEMELRSVIYNEPRVVRRAQDPDRGASEQGSGESALPDAGDPSTTAPAPTAPTTPDASDPVTGSSVPVTMPPTLFRTPTPQTPVAPARSTDDPRAAGSTTALYYFEAPVRQPFEYNDFPFDHKVVWVRIWPAEFEQNVVLVPDFDSYPCQRQPSLHCTGLADPFGVDSSIELGEFSREDTYFDYFREDYYTSNFGNENFQQKDYPELRYNVVIRRHLPGAFVSNLVPLLVAAGLAFGIVMTMTRDERRSRRFGFSTTQVMTTLAALFFAVLIAHQQLRNRFEGVVYFEYFYFLMYLVLLGVGVLAILISAPFTRDRAVFAFGDNLLAQVLYWPSLLLASVLITLVAL